MKRGLIILLVLTFIFSVSAPGYASDWDKAGIALTGIEGLRILSGGKVDLIGSMFGIGSTKDYNSYPNKQEYNKQHRMTKRYDCLERVWVPHYRWEKKYIPKHEEHHREYGKVIVEGHYIRYQVNIGGHWDTVDHCT